MLGPTWGHWLLGLPKRREKRVFTGFVVISSVIAKSKGRKRGHGECENVYIFRAKYCLRGRFLVCINLHTD